MMMIKMATPMPSQIRIFMSCNMVSTRKAVSGAASRVAYLPPHSLADSVGTAAEALSRLRQVIGLVLESIKALATLRNLVNVVSHHTDGVVDLLKRSC
jgi:hypothetical protein